MDNIASCSLPWLDAVWKITIFLLLFCTVVWKDLFAYNSMIPARTTMKLLSIILTVPSVPFWKSMGEVAIILLMFASQFVPPFPFSLVSFQLYEYKRTCAFEHPFNLNLRTRAFNNTTYFFSELLCTIAFACSSHQRGDPTRKRTGPAGKYITVT